MIDLTETCLNTLENPFIVDVSIYQTIVNEDGDIIRHIDWEKAYQRGVRVAVIRATIGNYRVDKACEYNFKACEALGILPTFYHVETPEYSGKEQAQYFLDHIPGTPAIPLVNDNELVRGCNPQKITACTQVIMMMVEDADKRPPFMYTSQGFWDMWVWSWSGWINYPLFVAWYPWFLDISYYKPFPVRRCPRDWIVKENGKKVSKYSLWQMSADGNGKGREYGMWSGDIDLSHYNGTLEDFERQFNVTIPDKSYLPVVDTTMVELADGYRIIPVKELETMRSRYQMSETKAGKYNFKHMTLYDFEELEARGI
ncbi:MAG: hypothetical protein JW908_00555 [Anaerolineales bacterium]|nr:hypothetical protein [Anaerolineales bacterium]